MRRILLPFTGQAISRRSFEAAVRLAKAENAVIMPAFLATVPMNLPLDTALPVQCGRGMPLLEAIEQRATAQGVPVDSRVSRGRSSRDALRKLIEQEHFDRIIVSADEDPHSGPQLRGPALDARARSGRDHDPQARSRGHPPHLAGGGRRALLERYPSGRVSREVWSASADRFPDMADSPPRHHDQARTPWEREPVVTSFQTGAAALGGMLVLGALLSGLARRSILSLAAVFVIAGFILGKGGLGVLEFRANSGFVGGLATVALIVILFRDGLEVEGELLRGHWQVPLRHLVVGMPITAGIVALLAHLHRGSLTGPSRCCWVRCSVRPTPCCPRGWSPTSASRR